MGFGLSFLLAGLVVHPERGAGWSWQVEIGFAVLSLCIVFFQAGVLWLSTGAGPGPVRTLFGSAGFWLLFRLTILLALPVILLAEVTAVSICCVAGTVFEPQSWANGWTVLIAWLFFIVLGVLLPGALIGGLPIYFAARNQSGATLDRAIYPDDWASQNLRAGVIAGILLLLYGARLFASLDRLALGGLLVGLLYGLLTARSAAKIRPAARPGWDEGRG